MHEIEIERTGPATYTVWFSGYQLVINSRSPEFDACRELLVRGHTGKLIARHKGSNVISFVLDIQKAAELTVLEGGGRPRFSEWRSFERGTREEGHS